MSEVSAFVGLGSNVGDRLANLRRAVEALDETYAIKVARASSVYDTDPVGPPQPDFLNAVLEVHTRMTPEQLLGRLKEIEGDIGRRPGERWGPREIDLDLLLYGTDTVATAGLRVPHPEIEVRAFVLVPLAEIAAFARVGDALVAELVERVDRSGVRPAHPPEALLPTIRTLRTRRPE